jgi:hypothetical protein
VQTLALEPPPLELPDLRPVEHPVAKATSLSTQRILAWVTLGAGAAVTGTAIGLGIGALNARSTYDQSGSTSVSDYNRALSLRTWTNVSWGIAAVLGGAGLGLMFIEPPQPTGSVRVAYGPGSISVQGNF